MDSINSLSNFIGFSFDISRHVNSQEKKILLIALAIISGFAVGYYFVRSFWSNKQIEQEGQEGIVKQDKPGIKNKIRALWNKQVKQDPVEKEKPIKELTHILPKVTGRTGALPSWQVTDTQKVFQKLYEFTKTQDPEAQRVKAVLKIFMNKNQTYPYLHVKLFNSSDFAHLGEKEVETIVLKECLNKGVHYCDYKVATSWGANYYTDLGLSEKFVQSFNLKINTIPTDRLFNDEDFRKMLFQVVAEMEMAINPTKKKDGEPVQEKIVPKTEPQKKEATKVETPKAAPLHEMIPSYISGMMSLPSYQVEETKNIFKQMVQYANGQVYGKNILEPNEAQKLKSILEAFLPKTQGYPCIRVEVYKVGDDNSASTTSQQQGIKQSLEKGCHFYNQSRLGDGTTRKILGFNLSFITSFKELYGERLKKAFLDIGNEMEKAI